MQCVCSKLLLPKLHKVFSPFLLPITSECACWHLSFYLLSICSLFLDPTVSLPFFPFASLFCVCQEASWIVCPPPPTVVLSLQSIHEKVWLQRKDHFSLFTSFLLSFLLCTHFISVSPSYSLYLHLSVVFLIFSAQMFHLSFCLKCFLSRTKLSLVYFLSSLYSPFSLAYKKTRSNICAKL